MRKYIFVILVSLLLFSLSCSGKTGFNGLQYNRSFTVSSTASMVAGSDVFADVDEVFLVLYPGEGESKGGDVYLGNKCKSDFSDIEFTNDEATKKLESSISIKPDGYAIASVKVGPLNPGETKKFNMYYGSGD